jgi:hypothetical protein
VLTVPGCSGFIIMMVSGMEVLPLWPTTPGAQHAAAQPPADGHIKGPQHSWCIGSSNTGERLLPRPVRPAAPQLKTCYKQHPVCSTAPQGRSLAYLVNLNQSPGVGLQRLDRLAILPYHAANLRGVAESTGPIRQPQLRCKARPVHQASTTI